MRYELHCTVETGQEEALARYVESSSDRLRMHSFLNVGPGGFSAPDSMTSERVDGYPTLGAAGARLGQRADHMRAAGLSVVRTKIEVAAWHGVEGATDTYLETHLVIMGWSPGLSPRWPLFMMSVSQHSMTWHATLRGRGSRAEHLRDVHRAVSRLPSGAQVVARPEQELVVYDSNPEHDAAWELASTSGGE